MSSPRRAPAPASGPALLVRQFNVFYSQLQSLAGRLRRGTVSAHDVRSEIKSSLEAQKDALRPLGAEFLADIAAPARRVMAAMVDQLFGSDLDWNGRSSWAPMAPELDDSSDRGSGSIGTDANGKDSDSSQVLSDLQHLLQVQSPSPAQKALGRVYLEALGLGLKQPFAEADVDDLKARLFALLYPQAPSPQQTSQDVPQVLFPEAYAHTVTQGQRELLPTARPWWRILAVASLILLIVSWPIWRDATRLVRAALDQVPATAAVSPQATGPPTPAPPTSPGPPAGPPASSTPSPPQTSTPAAPDPKAGPDTGGNSP